MEKPLIGYYHVELASIVLSKEKTCLQVPNFNDDIAQLKLKDILNTSFCMEGKIL
jgi:hypothetical protein